GTDRRIRIVDIATGKVIQTVATPDEQETPRGYSAMLRGFTADGKFLISQHESVSMWDVATGRQTSSWSLVKAKLLEKAADERHSWERIQAAAISPDGSQIAFALLKDVVPPPQNAVRDWFGRIVVLETATGKLVQQTDVEEEAFERITFSPDGKLLAAGGPWTVRVWKVGTERAAWHFEGHR